MGLAKQLLLGAATVTVLSSGAYAADLALPHAAAPAIVAATNWDGPYIGANVGYTWAHSDNTGGSIGDFDMTGGSIGAQVGYNFHLTDGIVAGVQGDIAWANVTGSSAGGGISDNVDWNGAITGRLGYDAGQFMPYVLAGIAFANSDRDGFGGNSDTETHTGWTVGAGVEAVLADHLTGFVEYRYTDYGRQTYSNLYSDPEIGLTGSSVRVGLNYHF